LSAYSAPLAPVRPQPYLLLHKLDADRLGIAADDLVLLSADETQLTLPARLSEHMAAGVVMVPRLRQTELESFYPGQPPQACRVKKVSAP
jgi:anaerobic selenocysteine-containing dehydrogenase